MATVHHYLLECHLYEEARNNLFIILREQVGLYTPDIYILLGYEGDEERPNWREQIMEELGQYVNRTETFKVPALHPNRFPTFFFQNFYQKHRQRVNILPKS